MSQSNIRVPPDSTGKRVAHRLYVDITYKSLTSDFATGQIITCPTSGFEGEVSHVLPLSATTGSLHVIEQTTLLQIMPKTSSPTRTYKSVVLRML